MARAPGEQLAGGVLTAAVTRLGGAVRRTAGARAPALHARPARSPGLGADPSPRPLGLDLESGTEVVSYVAGTVPSGGASTPYVWSEHTLTAVARLIRVFHDASASFAPPPEARWQQAAADPAGGDVI